MAEANNTKPTPDVIFEPFRWAGKELDNVSVPGRYLANMCNVVMDIAPGIQVILGLIEHDDIQVDAEAEPQFLMSRTDSGHLMRLAVQALELLNAHAEGTMNHAWRNNTDEGRAQEARAILRGEQTGGADHG